MQSDPMEEWRRLTALYSEMGDIEIRDLAAQINDLTPTAQQIFRDEIKKRGITERPTARNGSLPQSNALQRNGSQRQRIRTLILMKMQRRRPRVHMEGGTLPMRLRRRSRHAMRNVASRRNR